MESFKKIIIFSSFALLISIAGIIFILVVLTLYFYISAKIKEYIKPKKNINNKNDQKQENNEDFEILKESQKFKIEKEILSNGKLVEISFSTFSTYGEHDSSDGGEFLLAIIDKNGKVYKPDCSPHDWITLNNYIELKYVDEYTGNMRSRNNLVRIKPEACPVKLFINRHSSYSASDYPRYSKSNSSFYIVLVK